MRSFLVVALLFFGTASVYAQSSGGNVVTVPVNVSIWKGVSVNDMVASDDQLTRNHLSISLPYGEGDYLNGISIGLAGTTYLYSVRGLQLGGIGNITAEDFHGIQLNGLAGVIGEEARGIQASGLVGVSGGAFTGIQTSGLVSVSGEDFGGIQAGGLVAISGEDVTGLQLSGLASITGETMRGIQSAGFASIAGGEMRGIQLAGFASITGEESTGLQVAGFANIAGDNLRGIQVAGLANIAGEINGIQVGVLNMAGELKGLQVGVANFAGEDPEGISVGLFSRVSGVPVFFEASVDETLGLMLSVQSGSRFFKNYVGLGARPFGPTETRWDIFAGIGIERGIASDWLAGVDFMTHALIPEAFNSRVSTLLKLRAPITHQFSDRTALFVAPSVNLLLAANEDAATLAPYSIYESGINHPLRGWIGLSAGLRLQIPAIY